MAPVPSAPRPLRRCPHATRRRPACPSPRRRFRRLRVAPHHVERPAGLRFRRAPEGDRRPGLTRRPPRSPVTFADSSSSPTSRRSSPTRFEVAVNTVRAPIPLVPRGRCGCGPKPPPHRPGLRCALRNEHQSRRCIRPGQGLFRKTQGYPRNFFVTPRIGPFIHPLHTVHAQQHAQATKPHF